MGSGHYSSEAYHTRSISEGRATKSVHDNFTSRSLDNEMDPRGVRVREARDSYEHPMSLPIILGLDVTGSMLDIPQKLIVDGLPTLMDGIMEAGIEHPQVMFMGIGDHECDNAPLQIGQFESSDELLEKWLKALYMEGGGGGNRGESYLLAWYFASMYSVTDHYEKRGEKGFLFTVGDEPCLHDLPAKSLNNIMGPGQHKDYSRAELLELAQERWHVYHLHVTETPTGRRKGFQEDWEQFMHENVIPVQNHKDIPTIMAGIIAEAQE